MLANSIVVDEIASVDMMEEEFGPERLTVAGDLNVMIHYVRVMFSHPRVTSSCRVTIVGVSPLCLGDDCIIEIRALSHMTLLS